MNAAPLRVASVGGSALAALFVGWAGGSALAGPAGSWEVPARLAVAAAISAAAAGIWRRKLEALAAVERGRPAISLARGDWAPLAAEAERAAALARPVPLAPLEAALVAGCPPAWAAAALLAELVRAGVLREGGVIEGDGRGGDPPALFVAGGSPAGGDPYARAAGAGGPGARVGTEAVLALLAHAADALARRAPGAARAASAAYFAAAFREAPGAGNGDPWPEPLLIPAASVSFARDVASGLDPERPPATAWVPWLARLLRPAVPAGIGDALPAAEAGAAAGLAAAPVGEAAVSGGSVGGGAA
ncbi:MAG: hypothetical protein L0216_08105 [Planctomycetales bacterium]|nr:hypothetical protein [Planctomycetales bacterium]